MIDVHVIFSGEKKFMACRQIFVGRCLIDRYRINTSLIEAALLHVQHFVFIYVLW